LVYYIQHLFSSARILHKDVSNISGGNSNDETRTYFYKNKKGGKMNSIQKGVLLGVCMILVLGVLDIAHAYAVPAGNHKMSADAIELPNGGSMEGYEGTECSVVWYDFDGDGTADMVLVQWINQIPWIIIITPE
jgi:hypothetical protein